jgi:hypothetical protein
MDKESANDFYTTLSTLEILFWFLKKNFVRVLMPLKGALKIVPLKGGIMKNPVCRG